MYERAFYLFLEEFKYRKTDGKVMERDLNYS